MSYSLNSLKGMEKGDYHRVLRWILGVWTLAHIGVMFRAVWGFL